MDRFKAPAAVLVGVTAAALSAAPAFGAPAVPDHVDLPSVPSAAQSAPAASVPRVETPRVEVPRVEVPQNEVPAVEAPAVPDVETPDVELPAPVATVTAKVDETVTAATGSDVSATVERVVSTGDRIPRVADAIDETVSSAVGVSSVTDPLDRTVALADDRDAVADDEAAGAPTPIPPGPSLDVSSSPAPTDGAPVVPPAAPLASSAQVEREVAGAEAAGGGASRTAADVSALPLRFEAPLSYSAAEPTSRAAAKSAPSAPPIGAYASGATAAAGSSAPPSVAALLIALALLAPLTLFAFKEAPAFLRPVPFVALLERPG